MTVLQPVPSQPEPLDGLVQLMPRSVLSLHLCVALITHPGLWPRAAQDLNPVAPMVWVVACKVTMPFEPEDGVVACKEELVPVAHSGV